MMKRTPLLRTLLFRPGIAGSVLVIASTVAATLSARAQRGRPLQRMMEKKLDKDAAGNTGPAPDYANLYYWAAFPGKQGPADSIPEPLREEKRDTLADVFYIHPTTYIGADGEEDPTSLYEHPAKAFASMQKAAWNADLNDSALNRDTDLRPLLYQATAFNGVCRIFAPRYRQANLKAFLTGQSERAKQALDLAYSDVRAAFQYYLEHENHGRPIIIASHSQGSVHAIRLLKEFFDGKALGKQLVCAYVVGYQIKKDAYSQLSPCRSPSATGCFVGWRSFQKGDLPKNVKEENGNSVCINPLTWSADSSSAGADHDHGALIRGFNHITPQFAGAIVEPSAQILWVTLPEDAPDRVRKLKNLHIYDYNLFWMNIRENARQRVNAFLSTKGMLR